MFIGNFYFYKKLQNILSSDINSQKYKFYKIKVINILSSDINL